MVPYLIYIYLSIFLSIHLPISMVPYLIYIYLYIYIYGTLSDLYPSVYVSICLRIDTYTSMPLIIVFVTQGASI